MLIGSSLGGLLLYLLYVASPPVLTIYSLLLDSYVYKRSTITTDPSGLIRFIDEPMTSKAMGWIEAGLPITQP